MSLRNGYHRHLILLFVVGFTWGYVAKVMMGAFYYIGWGDPQVMYFFPLIDMNQLAPEPLNLPHTH